MLVDSGCTRTLVHRKFVPNNAETGNFMSVLLANGDTLEIPLEQIYTNTFKLMAQPRSEMGTPALPLL